MLFRGRGLFTDVHDAYAELVGVAHVEAARGHHNTACARLLVWQVAGTVLPRDSKTLLCRRAFACPRLCDTMGKVRGSTRDWHGF